jgi:hypothetical protein
MINKKYFTRFEIYQELKDKIDNDKHILIDFRFHNYFQDLFIPKQLHDEEIKQKDEEILKLKENKSNS